MEDEASETGWDGAAPMSHVHRCAVCGPGGDFDGPVAQDRLNRIGSDPGAGFDHHTGLGVCCGCVVGVHKDGQQRCRRLDGGAVAAGEGVDADRPQGVGVAGGTGPVPIRIRRELVGFRVEGLDEASPGLAGEVAVDPPLAACSTVGSVSSRLEVETRAFAVSGDTSNRPVTHSAIDREPSAHGVCRRSASRIRTI